MGYQIVYFISDSTVFQWYNSFANWCIRSLSIALPTRVIAGISSFPAVDTKAVLSMIASREAKLWRYGGNADVVGMEDHLASMTSGWWYQTYCKQTSGGHIICFLSLLELLNLAKVRILSTDFCQNFLSFLQIPFTLKSSSSGTTPPPNPPRNWWLRAANCHFH